MRKEIAGCTSLMHFFFTLALALIDGGFFSLVFQAPFSHHHQHPPAPGIYLTPTSFHNYSKNNLKLRMKCQRSVANSGVYEKEDLYGKKVPKKEKKKKSDGLLTEVFHGLGEKSLESVQTVALRVHTLKA